MRTCASLPKPVVTPYIVSPRAMAVSTVRREPWTAAGESAATATGAPWRGAGTKAPITRGGASRGRGGGMGERELRAKGGGRPSVEGGTEERPQKKARKDTP